MRIRIFRADPAGNLTGFVLSPVHSQERAGLAARLMAQDPSIEQVAFIDEASLSGPLPRMDMMGGEFCGNATRSFALYAAKRRAEGERTLLVSVSGAGEPVRVWADAGREMAYADMPLPRGVQRIRIGGGEVPVVYMEGIAHAVLLGEEPSQARAREVLEAMPREDAQGVLFAGEGHLTPLVYVRATNTCVWEGSCGSGSVALAWLLALDAQDGEHAYAFTEPGGVLEVRVRAERGKIVRAVMGGKVVLGEEEEIDVPL
ncbi:MAG: hypothetical protein Q4G52_01165 [Clostridia bacterium]|nr:hypothetical protein [Clostridia bacterium]